LASGTCCGRRGGFRLRKNVLTWLFALLLAGAACVTEGSLSDGARCSSRHHCASGNCIDGVCCAQEFCPAGDCYSCAVPGLEGLCHPIPAGQGRCVVGLGCETTCDGSGGCDLSVCERPDADPCSGNWECTSGHCEQGVCCGTACTGPCRSCAAYQPGVCVDVPAGEDPHGDCALGECPATCDGAGACDTSRFDICGSDQCVDGAADLFGRPTNASATSAFCVDSGLSCPGVSGPSQACGLYVCDGTACGARCDYHADCVSGAVCASGGCQPCGGNSDCSPREPYCRWGPSGTACTHHEATTCGSSWSVYDCNHGGFGSLCSIASDACQCVPGDGACNGRGPRCDGNPGSCTCGATPGNLCPVGQLCTDATTSGTCKIAPMFPHTADPADCASGFNYANVCTELPAGSPCTVGADCWPGHCGATWTCE
jgi:hypothetical protein